MVLLFDLFTYSLSTLNSLEHRRIDEIIVVKGVK